MQHSDGGWRYTRRPLDSPSDTSVTGWQVLALASSREAGLPVSSKCLAGVRTYFDSRTVADGKTDYLDPDSGSDAMTGVGMLARQFLLGRGNSPLVTKAAAYLAGRAESRTLRLNNTNWEFPYYVWYNCSLAMFQAGGEAWQRWNAAIRDVVAGLQNHEGCQRGSWDPLGADGAMGGRIYSTALAILTLEVYYRYASPAERAAHVAGTPPAVKPPAAKPPAPQQMAQEPAAAKRPAAGPPVAPPAAAKPPAAELIKALPVQRRPEPRATPPIDAG